MVLSGSRDLIYKAGADGAAVRRLGPRCAGNCLGDSSPTYSRSGARIAFERAFGPLTGDNAAAVAILTMNADGSGLKQLTQKKKPTSTEDHTPSWSPDGKRIAFQRYNTTAQPASLSAIYVMNADGTQLRRLTPLPGRQQSEMVSRRDENRLQRLRRGRPEQERERLHDPHRRHGSAKGHALHRRHKARVRQRLVARRAADRVPPHRRQSQRPLRRQRRRDKHPRADPPRPGGEPAPLRLGNSPLTSSERPVHRVDPAGRVNAGEHGGQGGHVRGRTAFAYRPGRARR